MGEWVGVGCGAGVGLKVLVLGWGHYGGGTTVGRKSGCQEWVPRVVEWRERGGSVASPRRKRGGAPRYPYFICSGRSPPTPHNTVPPLAPMDQWTTLPGYPHQLALRPYPRILVLVDATKLLEFKPPPAHTFTIAVF